MDMKDAYDPSKIVIPKTDVDFWLALLRVCNHYLAEAGIDHAQWYRTTGEFDPNHIWHAWLKLDSWLDHAFCEWRME